MLVENYNTPEGHFDFPFAYVFDGRGLTDGLAQVTNLSKTLQGDSDFILRWISGVNTCVDAVTGRFDFKNASGSYAMQNGGTSGVKAFPNWVVLPEKFYGRNTQIVFDLYNTLKLGFECGGNGGGPAVIFPFIAFFGVKRFSRCVVPSSVKFTPVKYTYSYNMTIDVDATSPQPIRQSQPIDNYDFELQRISISIPGQATPLVFPDFSVTLYDSNMNQTSDLPLPLWYINSGLFSAGGSSPFQGIWPVPTLVYPAGSAITFDVTSLLCPSSIPKSYNVALEGIWRVPSRC